MTYYTQRERLLKVLSSGRWISLPYIVEVMGIYRVSARIYELRRQLHGIERREIRKGRKRLVSYRLVM